MKITVITGMAGAGKSTVLDTFEDLGYYIIDNLPPSLIKEFIVLFERRFQEHENLAVVMDLRLGSFFDDIFPTVEELKEAGHTVEIIFVDASTTELLKRFNETRRMHPLEVKGQRREAIENERGQLEELKQKSDMIIDTSSLSSHQLRKKLHDLYRQKDDEHFQVIIYSYGVKHGDLEHPDYVFDLRHLPNPFYVDGLRQMTGEDQEVRDYILSDDGASQTWEKTKELIDTVLPLKRNSGRNMVTIGFMCTGGRHRSVTFARLMSDHLMDQGYSVNLIHRDISHG